VKISALIVLAVRRAVEDDSALLGVRLSPVTLSGPEVVRLTSEARRVLGVNWYVSASAPDVAVAQTERSFTAPDQRAAEQATAWRNSVRVTDGEHLLYVSAEEHDKASGLRDCLLELTDEALALAFLDWCATPESGMPKGIHDALKESDLVHRLRPSALCAFAEAIRKGSTKDDAWRVAGEELPLLGLARDTGLRRGNAVERLEANQRLVGRAGAGETRRLASSGPLAPIEAELRSNIAEAGGADDERVRALSSVDLGAVQTGQLHGPRPKPRRAPDAGARRQNSRKATKTRRRVETPSETELATQLASPSTETISHDPLLPVAVSATARPKPRPSTPELPAGLGSIVAELLRSEGATIVYSMGQAAGPGAARRWLTSLPATVTADHGPGVPAALGATATAWTERRRELLDAIGGDTQARFLVRAPQVLLAESVVRTAAEAFMNATETLYREALAISDEAVHEILNLETATLRDGAGAVLRLLGPLHPLVLGQALHVATALASADPNERSARRLLVHALRAPAAPAQWPEFRNRELLLARPELGLVVYEREPEALSPSTLQNLGERLLTHYLALCPYGHLGLRVVVLGDASNFVEGLARGALATNEDLSIEIATASPVVLRSAGSELLGQLRLTLRAVPSDIAELRPHLLVRLSPPVDRPEDEEPPDSAALEAARTGLLRTTFDIGDRGLRARTAVAGVPALEAVEALHAAARGRRPRGEFLVEAHALTLGATLPSGATPATWQVIVGARLGRRPPLDMHLLAFEVLEGANCAVVSRDLRPAGRAVAEGLRRLGILEERTRALNTLASQLAGAHAGGLLSLQHSNDQRIAAGVLALQLRRQHGGIPIVVVPVDGAPYEAIVGDPAAADTGGALLLGLAVAEGALAVTVGYATLDATADVVLSRGDLTGAVGQRLARVVEVLELAGSRDGLGGTAARQVLAWLIWPTVAAEGANASHLITALRSWERGGDVRISVTCLLPPELLGRARPPVRFGKHDATVLPLDVDLFNRLLLSP